MMTEIEIVGEVVVRKEHRDNNGNVIVECEYCYTYPVKIEETYCFIDDVCIVDDYFIKNYKYCCLNCKSELEYYASLNNSR